MIPPNGIGRPSQTDRPHQACEPAEPREPSELVARNLFDEVDRDWDVIVIGAGPAGSAGAISCARRGLKVALVDAKAFPRRKVCGGCLNQVSVQLLRDLVGPENQLWKTARPLNRFALHHRGQKFCFPMPSGCAMDRAVMDQGLVDVAMALGVKFFPNVTAVLAQTDSPHTEHGQAATMSERQVTLAHQRERLTVAARVVVLACGLGNRSAASGLPELQQIATQNSRVGIEAIFEHFPAAYAADTIHMVVARAGYVGLTQITGGRLHVAAAVDRSSLQQHGPGALLADILDSAGAAPLGDEAVVWRGTPPLTARAQRLAAERVFLVGDAAGYVEPFTGEGIRWGLETGIGVAEFAERACAAWDRRLIADWEAWYRRRIAPEQRLCRQITTGLKHPVLRWLAHQTLRVHPRLASMIIQRLNSHG